LPYKPWCPKCGDSLYLDETQWTPVVACRCGFRIVDQNQIGSFVAEQRKEHEERETRRQELMRRKIEEAREAEREAARREAEARKVEELPQPTPEQRRQGYTCAVHCEVCRTLVWRRRGAVKKGGPFFCSRKHQNAWFKEHPRGVIKAQARSAG
jgi:hypothetical protein